MIQLEVSDQRRELLKKGFALQSLTVAWNIIEGAIALFAGINAGSTALIGFGVDSFIETASAAIVGTRLWREYNRRATDDIDRMEKRAAKLAGFLLLALAVFVLIESVRRLLGFDEHAHETKLGLALTVVALAVMPVLARAKLRVAAAIDSAALKADAMETVCCAWLAGSTLIGLVLNMVLHWWWADSLAGIAIVPLLVREALESIKGEECKCHSGCS